MWEQGSHTFVGLLLYKISEFVKAASTKKQASSIPSKLTKCNELDVMPYV